MRYAIRPMQVEDIPQANEIERECFPTQWPPTSYKAEMLASKMTHYFVAADTEAAPEPAEQRAQGSSSFGRLVGKMLHLRGNKSAPSQTASQRIVGFAGVWIIADEAHLTTIGVREAYRSRGIGELLLMAAISLATVHHAQMLALEVRASNFAAIKLYEKYGFVRVGLRRGYYSEDGEDAVLMSIEKLTSSSFQSRFQQLKQAHAQIWGPADYRIS